MSRPSLRCIAALALCLALAASGPLAAKPRTELVPRAEATLESASAPPWKVLWNLLLSLWSKGGCSADPFGPCLEGQALNWTKGGCSIDPYGHCILDSSTTGSIPAVEGGCGLDPYGACR